MASRTIDFVLALAFVAALVGQAAAQSGCTATLVSLSPCLNYITGNSSTPSSNCCSQLSNVVQSSPSCLCSVINGAAASALGITVNQTLALSLPGACQVNTSSLSRCQDSSAPTSSANPPGSSNVDSPSEAPEAALTPSATDVPILGGGSKSVPSTDGGSTSSNGRSSSSSKVLRNVLFFLFFIMSFSSSIVTF